MTDAAVIDPGTLARIQRDGFANVGAIIDADTVATMRGALQRAIDEDLLRWSDSPWFQDQWMVHNLMLRDPVFLAFLDNPVLHAWLSSLLSPHCILYAYTSSSLPANGSNYSRRIHVDAQAQTLDLITNVGVMLALDDYSDANGATWYLPGSQRSLTAPDETHFFAHAQRVYPKAGEAVLFNARTFHYGGVNSTATPRHAVTLNVCRPWMKQRFDYPRMLSEKQLADLGPAGRRLVGLDSRVPTSLDDYYVAPEQRLFKSGQY